MPYPEWFVKIIQSIPNKRPRVVAQHILEHGQITTAELETIYGYKHPPRAARDLREAGIPLETLRVKDEQGRTIAAYRFGDMNQIQQERLAGRQSFPKQFKKDLIAHAGQRCAICNGYFAASALQIDHCVPYEVAGEPESAQRNLQDYQLLCGSCNRAKSWGCEHCSNWQTTKSKDMCLTCYWANPNEYTHVANEALRRIALVWQGNEAHMYDALQQQAFEHNQTLSEFMKTLLQKFNETP